MVAVRKRCSDCGSTSFIIDVKTNESYCGICGLVENLPKSLKEKVIFT